MSASVVELWRVPKRSAGLNIQEYYVDFTTPNCAVDPDYEQAKSTWKITHQGEYDGEKWAFASIRNLYLHEAPLCIVLVPVKWSEGKAFGSIVAGSPSLMQESMDAFRESEGIWPLPNICAVHVGLETSDRQLVLTKRAPSMSFHPNTWSASFEEALERSDFAISGSGILWLRAAV